MTEQIAGFDVEHLYGPEEISYTETELVVICLVRNGLPWVRSFVEHYLSLGIKHVVFLDNDSTDGTVDACSGHDGVTVLRTRAPFRQNEGNMRRYLIDRFGEGRWSLCVDIDEFFDYPYSDVMGLDSLLGYLNSKSYTAVTARMLDMFPEKLSSDRTRELYEDWQEEHRFYDISGLKRSRMSKDDAVFRKNVFDSDEVAVEFRGGIRDDVFGFRSPRKLTKFPLMFSDGKLRHFGPHQVRRAKVADFTCVLFHYKFYAFSLQDYWRKSFEFKKDKGSSNAYEQYLTVLEKNSDRQLNRETSKEISGVNELLENRFLVASEDYIGWVNAEDERRLSLAGAGSEPRALAEALLESRRQERAKTLRLGRLEDRLGDRDAKIQALEKQRREHRQKLQNSRRSKQRLTRKIDTLEQQLEDVRSSRVWKLAEALRHHKLRLQALRRRSR